jgi:hypothetical protein
LANKNEIETICEKTEKHYWKNRVVKETENKIENRMVIFLSHFGLEYWIDLIRKISWYFKDLQMDFLASK